MSVNKILIVDDNDTDLKNLEGICSGAGYSVVTAKSGEEAVAKAKSDKPDAILMDVVMEPMNGFQACRSITSDDDTKNIPVILVSSKDEKTDKVWAEEQGATGYVTKPYTPDQILSEIQSL